ncbi:MAG TPA: DUF3828 domain-containing protein [Rhizomicrobium sp.]|jgi:hypothetical protein|nr:DUF3828 domain-containing protein [Rhizomicrobium sp.]
MRLSKITVLVAAVLYVGTAWADDAKDAKAFIAGLFATYQDNSRPPAGSHRIYDAQLQALMDEDVRLAEGEVPALDFDPLCQCQDYQHLQANQTVRSASSNAAILAVTIRDAGMPNEKPRNAVFDLVKENGHWRIHDIHADDPKSLREFLIQQNAERAKTAKEK